jgi:flagellin-like hook-associated protein FlgL
VTAAANPTGNGITLTDTAAGSGNVSVAAGTGYVSNGTDLGLFKTGAGATLTGGSVQFATDDFKVTRRDGTSFTVSVAGARTVQDVIAAINSADGNGAAATKVTAGLAAAGNGIVLSDASGGPGALVVAAMNGSPAAGQLGIYKSAGAGSPGVVTGDDVNALMPGGVFSALAALRDALKGNDTAGITRAAAMLEADGARVLRMRGEVGARGKDIEGRQDDLQAEELGLKKSLSLLEDTDFTEAATRFQTLQTAFEATLKVAQSTSNLSLLDFLK